MTSRSWRIFTIAVFAAIALLSVAARGAAAEPAEQLAGMSIVEPFDGSSASLLRFGSSWSPLGWAGGSTPKGSDTTEGWRLADASPAVNGAFYKPVVADTGAGIAAVATMAVSPNTVGNQFSLWLDMPTAATTKAGYELRFTYTAFNTYTVTLSKWVAGAQTILATKNGYSFASGNSFAIVDLGGGVTAWTKTGAAFTSLLGVADSTYSSGNAGVQGSGSLTRLTGFKVGSLNPSTANLLAVMPVTESFDGSPASLANFGTWSPLNWAGGSTPKGSDTTEGWRPADASPAVNGAFYKPVVADTRGEIAAVATMAASPNTVGNQFSLWLDMPTAATTKTGYELAFAYTAANTYTVTLYRWVGGVPTLLAGKTGYSFVNGNSFAIVDQGGTVSGWTKTGTAFVQLFSAADSTFSSGNAGVQGSGNLIRLTGLKAGSLYGPSLPPPPNTTISTGPSGVVVPNLSFGFTSTEGSNFECTLDGAVFSICTSPKELLSVAEGSHTFQVRAGGIGGADPTPAARSFKVVAAAKAVSRVMLWDSLERAEAPLATGKWSKSSWAGEIGGAWLGAYRGYGSTGGAVAGAYWNPTAFGDGEGTVLVAGSVGTGALAEGQYLALWLDMPSPGSARSGYEARFTGVNGSATNYKVELAKWVAGTRTVLAATSAFSLPVGTTIALTETAGGNIALWTGTSTMSPALSARDLTYTSGYAGLEVNGGAGTIYNFRAGQIDIQPPETTIDSGPSGAVLPENVSFGFSSTEAGSSFECSLDAGAFGACSSPKSYLETAPGSHTFRVRAVDPVGNPDETPAQRTFQVIAPPSATTGTASSPDGSQGTLNASINPNGAATTYQFEFGTTVSYGKVAPASPKAIGSGSEAVQVSEGISGLQPGTTYHYRVTASSLAGVSHSADASFKSPTTPTTTTNAVSALSATEATLEGAVNPGGATTTYQFEYGLTPAYGQKAPLSPKAAGSGTESVELSEAITGLVGGTTYHYRIVAMNGVGITYGEEKSFTTLVAPEATTETATVVEANGAALEGAIDPNGSATKYYFEYGKTPSYETIASGEEVGEGSEPIPTSGPVGYLEPETTYHYRVVAVSSAGIDFGEDKTLTTAARVMSASEEHEIATAESAFTATADAKASANAGRFFGMMWTGQLAQTLQPNVLASIKYAGAKMLRVVMSGNPANYAELFRQTSRRGITILPYIGSGAWPAGAAGQATWATDARNAVAMYGPEGSFWNGVGNPHPVVAWEIWNEPNMPKNSPNNKVDAAGFGNFFALMAKEMKAAVPPGKSIHILTPGLFGYQNERCLPECHVQPVKFLEEMKHGDAYDAISIHPYVFKVQEKGDSESHKPESRANVIAAREEIYSIIAGVRDYRPDLPIWVTELGFAVANPGGNVDAFPPVSEVRQRELVEASFAMLSNYRGNLHLAHAFYYNIQDAFGGTYPGEWPGWEYHAGLRKAGGAKREAWGAYARAAEGKENWSSKRKVKNLSTTRKAKQATSSFAIETQGARYRAWGELGSGPTPAEPKDADYPWETGPVVLQAQEEGEDLDESVDVSASVQYAGLTPGHLYHYRIAVEDEGGDIEYSPGGEFTTEPSTRTTASFRTLNGESGWVNVSGTVTSSEHTINAPDYVNVNFWKKEGGVYVFNAAESTAHASISQGAYSLENWRIGKGEWKVNVVFPGFGEDLTSESGIDVNSPEPDFKIKNGYQLVSVSSGKCLEVTENGMVDGVNIHQEECGVPANRFDQVFTLVPSPNAPSQYQIVARNSNKCLQVRGASSVDGAAVEQSQCAGWGALNQVWEGVPVGGEGHVEFVAKHSNKCLSIQGGGSNNGALAVQAPCVAQAGQVFRFESVESNQVPLEASITVDNNDTFNGEPGYVSFHGNVDAGGYDLSGRTINVNFGRETSPGAFTSEPSLTEVLPLSASGHFELKYKGIGHANWHTRAVFTGAGPLAESASEYRGFQIGSGYRFRFRQSEMCLTTNGGGTASGTLMVQYPCVSTAPSSGQVYSVVPLAPVGSNDFQIRPNSVGSRCVAVAGGPGATGNGAVIQLSDCDGGTNQSWHVQNLAAPNEAWNAFIAKHSGRCMTVSENSTVALKQFLQWDCAWAGSQQWEWQGIG
jgi:hypothetical protein